MERLWLGDGTVHEGRPQWDNLQQKRWLGALMISRRLKVDYETLLHVSAAALLFASITRLVAAMTMRRPFPNGLSTLATTATVFEDRFDMPQQASICMSF
jgi:hypothetical protein